MNAETNYVRIPKEPTLAMLDAGWGICGTALSSMQPNQDKIAASLKRYQHLLESVLKGVKL
jgi:hypothetical protein